MNSANIQPTLDQDLLRLSELRNFLSTQVDSPKNIIIEIESQIRLVNEINDIYSRLKGQLTDAETQASFPKTITTFTFSDIGHRHITFTLDNDTGYQRTYHTS